MPESTRPTVHSTVLFAATALLACDERILYDVGMAWHGVAWRGVAWRGVVWRGVVWRGVVWCGVAWRHSSTRQPL